MTDGVAGYPGYEKAPPFQYLSDIDPVLNKQSQPPCLGSDTLFDARAEKGCV